MITFFELLEHVEEPKRFLDTVRGLLKDDGFIALSVPDLNRFGPWELKINTAPYHTAYWTPELVTKFLNNHGFNVVKIKKINRPDSVSMMMNLLIRLKIINIKEPDYNINKSAPVGAPAKGKSLKSMGRSVFHFLTIPLTELLYLVSSLRPAIFVIAQRKD